MGRRGAKALHLALFLVGVVLYVTFVLPRWWVLTGDIPTAVATAGRIAAGIPIALAALPVLAILRLALSRKAKTPELALRLRAWSAVLHVVAGALILVTAVIEIWLRLAVGGPFLFAVYGAAGAIAILAVLALYLSFVAEKPPAPPKPPKPVKPAKAPKAKKPKAAKEPRRKKRGAAAGSTSDKGEPTETTESADENLPASEPEETGAEAATETTPSEVTIAADANEHQDRAADTTSALTATAQAKDDDDAAQPTAAVLRNKRPGANSRHRLRR